MTPARSTLVFLVLAAGSCAAMLLGACRETATSSVTLREAGVEDATLSPDAWGTSACASCALVACDAERERCSADPLCARHLDCLESCDVDNDQEPAAACAAQCPATSSSSESEVSRAALELCLTRGAGAVCTSCYGGARKHYDPALTNVCENPQWDAGPDATATDEILAKCQAERCCTDRAACVADPQCNALIDCVIASNNDATMIQSCYGAYDSAIALYGARYACLYSLCAPLVVPDENECNRCQENYCSDALAACLSTHDCFLLFMCVSNCAADDSQCAPNCYAKYPEGVDGLVSWSQCAAKQCPICLSGAGGSK